MVRAAPPDTTIETTFPSEAPAPSLPRELRVVTFNVHRETPSNVLRAVNSDPMLRDADLIILEEVHRLEPTTEPCSAACALGKDLGYYTLYAPGHMQGDGSDGVAILSRAPILSGQVMELPDIDVHVNSGRRVALIATVLVNHAPVTVYAVHLTNRLTVAERKAQMRPILEHVKRQTTPVIMGGDFNTSPFTWVGGLFPVPIGTQDDHLEALVRTYGLDTPVASSGPTSRFLGMKLDAIYTRGFATHEFAVAHAQDVSDHLALWANLVARR
ncbi:MAG: endonuclease/exonuclease/phosphatase family protein [Myxococcales bacterium]|nr:endonuclease/exonuclease/phosphatase family protein [Myxococcales bacterium]